MQPRDCDSKRCKGTDGHGSDGHHAADPPRQPGSPGCGCRRPRLSKLPYSHRPASTARSGHLCPGGTAPALSAVSGTSSTSPAAPGPGTSSPVTAAPAQYGDGHPVRNPARGVDAAEPVDPRPAGPAGWPMASAGPRRACPPGGVHAWLSRHQRRRVLLFRPAGRDLLARLDDNRFLFRLLQATRAGRTGPTTHGRESGQVPAAAATASCPAPQ